MHRHRMPIKLAEPRRQWWLMKRRFSEAWRYSHSLRHGHGHALWAKSRLAGSPAERLNQLCLAYSKLGAGPARESISAELEPWIDGPQSRIWREQQVGRERHASAIKALGHGFVSRTVMVKAPGDNGEKGVLITYFEYNFQRLLDGIPDYREFTSKYSVIYSTSWSPTSYHLLGNLLAESTGPVFIQACNYGEIPALHGFHSRVRCLETLPCDWLQPAFYQPRPYAERDIDLLVVSNWAPFKRHWALFNALRELPENLRVVCVGQPETGHTIEKMRAQQRLLGARQNIEFVESIPIEEVTALQCRARVCAIFSRREGCCVAATESLMAGAALALVGGACIGPLAYVNDQTGFVLDDRNLAAGLRQALAEAHDRQPREYAMSRLSCDVSARKLNELLKQEAVKEGRPWTRDIHTPCWRPYPQLVEASAKAELFPAFRELQQRYPAVFPEHLMDTSHR